MSKAATKLVNKMVIAIFGGVLLTFAWGKFAIMPYLQKRRYEDAEDFSYDLYSMEQKKET